jgi:hypothetical protein
MGAFSHERSGGSVTHFGCARGPEAGGVCSGDWTSVVA